MARGSETHNHSDKAQLDTAEQQQQPGQAGVASESLLRDQHRALLAQLRTAELEVQHARAGPVGGAALREQQRARPQMRQAVVKAAEIVVRRLACIHGCLSVHVSVATTLTGVESVCVCCSLHGSMHAPLHACCTFACSCTS
jgi:hypothetical protein